jgi:cell division protein FtsB
LQISAQESRRKKKDYVDALEKQIAKYLDENTALKQRMATIEKNQKYVILSLLNLISRFYLDH